MQRELSRIQPTIEFRKEGCFFWSKRNVSNRVLLRQDFRDNEGNGGCWTLMSDLGIVDSTTYITRKKPEKKVLKIAWI